MIQSHSCYRYTTGQCALLGKDLEPFAAFPPTLHRRECGAEKPVIHNPRDPVQTPRLPEPSAAANGLSSPIWEPRPVSIAATDKEPSICPIAATDNTGRGNYALGQARGDRAGRQLH